MAETTNLECICHVIDLIEQNLLDQKLNLDYIAEKCGYSKYHLHRMFTAVTDFPMHTYIKRRRLTEAARMLVFTDRPLIDIALMAGYETQRSFTTGFRSLFQCSPKNYRKKKDFFPVQLKFDVDGKKQIRGDRIMNIRTEEAGEIRIIGFHKNTRLGFLAIGQCWRLLHKNKGKIPGRTDPDFLIGLNDYSNHIRYGENPHIFDYYAGAETASISPVPSKMEAKVLPAGKYVVFSFHGKNEDSMQPVVEYIYQEWFPQSTCRLNENARFDFVKYGETVDSEGKSIIEYWVPIL